MISAARVNVSAAQAENSARSYPLWVCRVVDQASRMPIAVVAYCVWPV